MVLPGRCEREHSPYMESCVAWCRQQAAKGPQRLKRKWRHLAKVVHRLSLGAKDVAKDVEAEDPEAQQAAEAEPLAPAIDDPVPWLF